MGRRDESCMKVTIKRLPGMTGTITVPDVFWAQLAHIWFGLDWMAYGVYRFHYSVLHILLAGLTLFAIKELTDPLWESPETAGGFWGGVLDFSTLAAGSLAGAALIHF